ncbi:hypothetical protein AC249_AIPGENE369 [Exaiptasia diaphana]|nr:hypothetical protein AC249_AIPGENE369 [Exaiptasia diaphana]
MGTWFSGSVFAVDARGSEFEPHRGHEFLCLQEKRNSEDDNSISVDSESPDPASEFTELWGRMFLGPSTSDGVESRRLYRFRPVARQRISIRPRMGGEGGAGASNNATAEAAAIDF